MAIAIGQMAEDAGDDMRLAAMRDNVGQRRMFLGKPVGRTEAIADLAHGQLDRGIGAFGGVHGIRRRSFEARRLHGIGPFEGGHRLGHLEHDVLGDRRVGGRRLCLRHQHNRRRQHQRRQNLLFHGFPALFVWAETLGAPRAAGQCPPARTDLFGENWSGQTDRSQSLAR